MKNLILAVLIFLPLPAIACDSINLGVRSYHWDRGAVHKDQPQNKGTGLREKHSAIGCTNAFGRWDFLYFKNSKNKDTVFIGDEWRWRQFGRFSINIDYGLFFHGYSDKVPFLPLPLPKLSYETKLVEFNLYILYNKGLAAGLEFPL